MSDSTKENDQILQEKEVNKEKSCQKRQLLKKWLNKSMKVQITDGRTLIGLFLCTDKNSNIVLGSCKEYTSSDLSKAGLFLNLMIYN